MGKNSLMPPSALEEPEVNITKVLNTFQKKMSTLSRYMAAEVLHCTSDCNLHLCSLAKQQYTLQLVVFFPFHTGYCEGLGWTGITASSPTWPAVKHPSACDSHGLLWTGFYGNVPSLAYFQAVFPVSLLKGVQVEKFLKRSKPRIQWFYCHDHE